MKSISATQFLRFRPRQYLDENKFESYHLNMDETMIMNPTNHVSRQYNGRSHGRSTVPQNTRHVGMPQITMITFGIYQGDKGKSYLFPRFNSGIRNRHNFFCVRFFI